MRATGLQGVLRIGPAVKREAVAHLQAVMGLSGRRAYRIIAVDRKVGCYPKDYTVN